MQNTDWAKNWRCSTLLVCCTMLCGLSAIGAAPPQDPRLSGGQTTVFVTNRHAYAKSAANLPIEKLRDFEFGNRLFNTNWVIAPASVDRFDGLGPLFNRVSCSACHVRDGRGRPPRSPDEPMMSMLVRLSVPGVSEDGGPRPHPVYGGQFQDRAIPGVAPEGRCRVTYEEISGSFPDGEPYSLRVPRYEMADLKYGGLGGEILYSPRVANAVFGLGLLEAVPDETLLGLADPDDRDGDGISGRVNRVWDVASQRVAIGRFGWKANQPTLRQQAAGAFNGDIGITTSLFPREGHTSAQEISAQNGGAPEVTDEDMDKLVFYLRTLAVPARRNVEEPVVQHGQRLFGQIGCARCHVPSMMTGADAPLPQLSSQQIAPYTDLLLHDMGEGLADGRPDYEATGREWRTPPLWGLGLMQTVNGHTDLLHDGRARDALEAILWHGGEGQASRESFMQLPPADRQALLKFLESL